jgi:hypothetical protein
VCVDWLCTEQNQTGEIALNVSMTGRLLSASIAACTWIALLLQWLIVFSINSSALLSFWSLAAYFTILTNLLVAVVFTSITFSRPRGHSLRSILCAPWFVAGTTLSILLVGVIYILLLHGTQELAGNSLLANNLLHFVTPTVVPLFWLFFVRKGELRWHHPLLWAIYPLAYLVYGLVRGGATGIYAYPFLDVGALGWPRIAANATLIAVGFMLSGFALVWLDGRLAARAAVAPAQPV